MFARKVIAFLFAIFFTFGAVATAENLRWQECVERAAKSNPDIQSAELKLKAAKYQVSVARSGYFPRLTADFSSSRSSTEATVGTSDTSYSAGLAANQNLFQGFSDWGKFREAQANLQAAEADLRDTKSKVSLELKSAYEGVLYGEDLMALSKTIVQRRQSNRDLVKLRFQSGRENKGSLLLSEAYLQQAKLDDFQAAQSLGVSKVQLAKALGVSESESLVVHDPIDISEPVANVDISEIAKASPLYERTVASMKAADANVTTTRSAFLPSLDLAGNLGRQGPEFLPTDNRWTVGLTFSLPLFDGGRDFYLTQAANSNLNSSVKISESTYRQILVQLKQQYSAFLTAVEKLKVDESFQQAATVRSEIARTKYNTGLLSFEDWDLIENDLISRQKTLLSSRRDRVIAEAAWEQAQGKGVIQ